MDVYPIKTDYDSRYLSSKMRDLHTLSVVEPAFKKRITS